MAQANHLQPHWKFTMSADPSLDAILIEWGDRLFYPGNRSSSPTHRACVRVRAGPSSSVAESKPPFDERPRSWSRSPEEGGA